MNRHILKGNILYIFGELLTLFQFTIADQFSSLQGELQSNEAIPGITVHTKETKLKTCGQEEVIYLITTQNFFLLVPGQDMYKDSGNAKILDFFGLVPKL